MTVWRRPWDALLEWLDLLRWDWEMRRRFHREACLRGVDLSDSHHRRFGWLIEPASDEGSRQ